MIVRIVIDSKGETMFQLLTEMWFRRPLGEMTSDGIWVHAPTTERSMSELLRTEKIFHRDVWKTRPMFK